MRRRSAVRVVVVHVGEEIDQREQREIFGIGEKEAAQAAEPLGEPWRRVRALEPFGDRLFGETPDDRALPAPLIALIRAHQIVEGRVEGAEDAADRLTHEPAARVRAVVTESVTDDRRQGQSSAVGEFEQRALRSLDQIRAGLGVLTRPPAVANRPDASAHAVAGFEHRHGRAAGLEVACGRETRKPGAGDHHPGVG